MYVLALIELVVILVLNKKLRKKNDVNDDSNNQDKTILKVEQEKKEETKLSNSNIQESVKIEPPKVELLEEVIPQENEITKIGRKGSLEKSTYKADEIQSEGIKLVDLDKNDGPKDELTFNIFENLTDDDIKKMLEEQIDKDNK